MTMNGVYEFFIPTFSFFIQKYKIDIWCSPNYANKKTFGLFLDFGIFYSMNNREGNGNPL